MRLELKCLMKEYKYHHENESTLYCSLKSMKGLNILLFFIHRSQSKTTKNLSTSQPTFNQKDWEETGLL